MPGRHSGDIVKWNKRSYLFGIKEYWLFKRINLKDCHYYFFGLLDSSVWQETCGWRELISIQACLFLIFKNSEQSVHFRIPFQNRSSANTTSDILSWFSEPLEAMNQVTRPIAYLLQDSWLPSGPPISMAAVKPSSGLFKLKFVRRYSLGFLCFFYQQNSRLPSFSVHLKHRFLGPAATIHWVRERIRDSAWMCPQVITGFLVQVRGMPWDPLNKIVIPQGRFLVLPFWLGFPDPLGIGEIARGWFALQKQV